MRNLTPCSLSRGLFWTDGCARNQARQVLEEMVEEAVDILTRRLPESVVAK